MMAGKGLVPYQPRIGWARMTRGGPWPPGKPYATCPICGWIVSLRKDGSMCEHWPVPDHAVRFPVPEGNYCRGSRGQHGPRLAPEGYDDPDALSETPRRP